MAIAAITLGLIIAVMASNSVKKEGDKTVVYDYRNNPEVLNEIKFK